MLTILASTSLAEGANGFIEQELTYGLLLAIAGLIAILTRYVRLVRRVPYAVALVVVGLLVALFVEPVEMPISSDLILALLVPPLLFESTLHLKWRDLKDDLVPVLLLALGGSLVSLLRIAVQDAARHQVDASAAIREGPVRDTIETFIREVGADLLLLGAPRGATANLFGDDAIEQFASRIHEDIGIEVRVARPKMV